MINKIGLSLGTYKNLNKTNQTKRNFNSNLTDTSYQSIPVSADMLGGKCNISFGAKKSLTELESSFIGDEEIRVTNLFNLEEDINIPYSLMPNDKKRFNAAGLNISVEDYGLIKKFTISNNKGNVIAIAKVNSNADDLPFVIYKQGKYMPELTIKDSSLNGKSIKMLAGSELKARDFEIKMPGQYEPMLGEGYKNISFSGKCTFATSDMEQNTKQAVESYLDSGFVADAPYGDYKELVHDNLPEVICVCSGSSDRLKNITRFDENKLSTKQPTDSSFRYIGYTLNTLATAGLLDGENMDEIHFISQRHKLPQDDTVHWVPDFGTDGGAIAEGFKRGIIDDNKDSIILNANIFTNADISRAYYALKTLPNAGIVIPYFPVSSDRAKSFILLAVDKNDEGNFEIKNFVDKPKSASEPPDPNDFSSLSDYDAQMQEYESAQKAINPDDENSFLANSGMFFLSKEANKILMAQGIIFPQETDLNAVILPKILQMINEGKMIDENGNCLKAYTVPLERIGGAPAYWDDIGTAESYLRMIKDVAGQTQINGVGQENKFYGLPEFLMNDFHSNVDLDTGIVYDSYEARTAFDKFKSKFAVDNIQGNIYIAGR